MNENTLTVIERVEKSDRLAYKQKDAAYLLGLSVTSLWRLMVRRKIFPVDGSKLISKKELLRYLDGGTLISSRKRRTVRTKRLAKEARQACKDGVCKTDLCEKFCENV